MAIYEEHIPAFAKINLFLRVCGKRPDGYHVLSSLMQSISLCDDVGVQCSDHAVRDGFEPGIFLATNVGYLPNDAKNTAYKAARTFLNALGQKDISVRIHIRKQIPTQAGLAGGSTDAAAVLKALSNIFPGVIQRDELFRIAAGIGADVPFCMDGGTQLCEGIGDVLSPVLPLQGLPILLIKPACSISTPRAFSKYDELRVNHKVLPEREEAITRLLRAPQNSDPRRRIADAAPYLYNDLESVAEHVFPILADIRSFLTKQGAVMARMSGSGSTVYGIFEDAKTRDDAGLHADHTYGTDFFRYAGETV